VKVFGALLWGSLFLGIILVWILRAELITHTCQISESVPPIPALGVLLIFTAWAHLRRSKRDTGEDLKRTGLLVYMFLTVSVPLASVGTVRLLLPCLTVLRYFATPENRFEELQPHFPSWFAPSSEEVVIHYYEGAPDEAVPWGVWMPHLFLWGGFLLALWLCLLGISVILRKQWEDRERLSFPLLDLPIKLSDMESEGSKASFFRDPLMWVGFGLAGTHNLLNILNSLNPSIAALGWVYPVGQLFTERPLDALQAVHIHYRPEILGMGYLMPAEVSFSVWVSYLLLRLEAVVARMLGYELAGFPFDMEQAAGSFVALAFFYLWMSKGHLRQVGQRVLGRGDPSYDQDEPMSYRTAVLFAVGGGLFFLGWCVKAGMHPAHALLYGVLLLSFAVVYTRIRAEAGAPMLWLFPYYQQKKLFFVFAGSDRLIQGFGLRSMTVFSSLMFLSRGYFPELMAIQMENLRLGRQGGLRRKQVIAMLVAAMLIGYGASCFMHLGAYYKYGAMVLEGGSTEGGFRTHLARTDFQELANHLMFAQSADKPRIMASLVGLGISATLLVLRAILLKGPIHPLGFAMAAAYGDPLWSSFLLVWCIKVMVFRMGGVRLYRRLIPCFIGIVLGHFFIAGLLWGGTSFLLPEHLRSYLVHFG